MARAPLCRVLVVEDDPETAEVERSILAMEGFEIDIARDGAEALDRLTATRYQGIVLDAHLPGTDGCQVRPASVVCRSTATWRARPPPEVGPGHRPPGVVGPVEWPARRDPAAARGSPGRGYRQMAWVRVGTQTVRRRPSG